MRSSIVVVALAALALGACTTRPIVNVRAEPVVGAAGAAVTPPTYDVSYRDSTNLDYRDGQIHRNTNGWIENLNNAIRMELLRA